MLYAKSDKPISIQQHIEDLLKQLNLLKNIYGKTITNNIDTDTQKFWYLLELACKYHDIGKAYTPFQNVILKKLKKEELPTTLFNTEIRHEQLSPLFIPAKDLNLTPEEERILVQAIYYHHDKDYYNESQEYINKAINEDLKLKLNIIKKEIDVLVNEDLNSNYLGLVGNKKRIKSNDKLYVYYCLIKGLLNRLDHSASAGIDVEDDTEEVISQYVNKYLTEFKKVELNNLQMFCKSNEKDNLIIVGSTGMGKTEAGLLWSSNSKTFFTLPIRVSINAIYDRINSLNDIGYKNVGLLHSTAINYLLKENSEEKALAEYKQSKMFFDKIIVCTVDQIFPFVFKYNGYEKIYSIFSYSKIIIDEIQAYNPQIVAAIIKGLKMINDIGGRFMIMTATLPRIYTDYLKKLGISFKTETFISNKNRHKIKLENNSIEEQLESIVEKAKNKKVLIIVNTVRKSIELYNMLKKNNFSNINLLHSRFNLKDRTKKEEEIKTFAKQNNSGIWITTQIVEASLDIDFDYLFTEMSTLDSLFQRLGRCYRQREYNGNIPNVYVFLKSVSGIGNIYDEEIHKNSIDLLTNYDNEFLSEEVKTSLVDKLYSEDMLKDTNFLKCFREAITELEYIPDYALNKNQAQRIFRNIQNINVIPRTIFDKEYKLFDMYKQEKASNNIKNVYDLKRQIEEYSISINKYLVDNTISSIEYLPGFFVTDLQYDNEIGLILTKNMTIDVEDRCD